MQTYDSTTFLGIALNAGPTILFSKSYKYYMTAFYMPKEHSL